MRANAPRALMQGAHTTRKVHSPKEKCEVVLIKHKPDNEDKRNNEEIKAQVLVGLDNV